MHRVCPAPSTFVATMSRRTLTVAPYLAAALLASSPARADSPSVTVSTDQTLRFGSFFTDTAGSRTVSANGTVSGSAIIPVTGASPGPAQFTITYDRGNNANTAYSLLISVLMPGTASQVSGGVTGSLTKFDTDLPGIATLLPGQTVQATLIGCNRRTCVRTFRVGGTLQIARTTGGAQLAIPLPIVVTVLAEL